MKKLLFSLLLAFISFPMMNKCKPLIMKILYLFLTWLLLIPNSIMGQISSRNGYYHTSNGTIRAFIVFAEATNDPNDKGPLGSWTTGNMPPDADSYIDHEFTGPLNINGYITKYYYEASLGNLILIGDYYPNLVQIDYDSINGDGKDQVIDYLHYLSGSDITTDHGYSINSDFDSWTLTSVGYPKYNVADGYIDMLIIIWRTNSKFRLKRDGGHINCSSNWTKIIKNKSGFNCDTEICAGSPKSTFRHEFAHSLLGGNDFHSGGAGAGNGTYLSDVGGYGILSSWNSNLNFVNGWDRWRLGWKLHSKNVYYISARTTSGVEVNADFVYGQTLSTNEFILRDFASYGDAIRIKLPYLKSINGSTKEQYLWIENHQLYPEKIEYNSSLPKGIRLNIQVGNDNLTTFSNSTTNYLSPLSYFGNFDYTYSTTTLKSEDVLPATVESYEEETGATATYYEAATYNKFSNPFTGYHLLQNHAINYIDPNGSSDFNKIYDKEFVLPKNVYFNEEQIFSYYPIFGNQYDVFPVGSKLNICTNPSSSAVLTYMTPLRSGNPKAPYASPNSKDNRFIFLNGLSIEVLAQETNGDIKIRITWDNFDVNKDVRWCGPIILNERINLKQNKTLSFDQGLTPTKPVNPITLNDKQIFANPTIFTCRDSSYFKLESNSTVELKNNSTFIMESGSTLEINDGAIVRVDSGSTFKINDGAVLVASGNGEIIVNDGAYLCIENPAAIGRDILWNNFEISAGAIFGVNPSIEGLTGNCIDISANYNLTMSDLSVKDATINDGSPDWNIGGSSTMDVKIYEGILGGETEFQSLLEFDISFIPSGAQITEAKIVLREYPMINEAPSDCWMERITEPWGEYTVTWNNKPAYVSEGSLTLPDIPAQQIFEIDATDMVTGWLNNDYPNNGLLIRLKEPAVGAARCFFTHDYMPNTRNFCHPKLVVKYKLPEINIVAEKDALLSNYGGNVSVNRGTDPTFAAWAWTGGGVPFQSRSLIEFNLSGIPNDAQIVKATLKLYGADHNPLTNSNASFLQMVTSSWEENVVNWANQPSTSTTGQISLPLTTSPTQDDGIDVTDFVRGWYNQSIANNGLILKLQNEAIYTRRVYYSSDYTDVSKHPKLEVIYRLPEEISIAAEKDALLSNYGGNVSVNRGNDPTFAAWAWTGGGVPFQSRSLIEFDLSKIPNNAQVLSAKVSLYGKDHNPLTKSNAVYFQRVTSPWVESEVNWTNQPTVITEGQLSLPITTSAIQDDILDVTDISQGWVDGAYLNYGLLMILQSESYYTRRVYYSSDYADSLKHPELTVRYHPYPIQPVLKSGTIYDDRKMNEISAIQEFNDLSIYPNPSQGEFTISGLGPIIDPVIEITDILGRMVYREQILSQNEVKINISNQSKGVYFIRIISGKTNVTKKLLYR